MGSTTSVEEISGANIRGQTFYPPPPGKGQFISDVLGIIGIEDRNSIESQCKTLWTELGIPIMVATTAVIDILPSRMDELNAEESERIAELAEEEGGGGGDTKEGAAGRIKVDKETGEVIPNIMPNQAGSSSIFISNEVTEHLIHYTNTLFNQWGIGSKLSSTGILLLAWKHDPNWNFSIALGSGWADASGSTALVSSNMKAIANTRLLPKLKSSGFDGSKSIASGITSIVESVREMHMNQLNNFKDKKPLRHVYLPKDPEDAVSTPTSGKSPSASLSTSGGPPVAPSTDLPGTNPLDDGRATPCVCTSCSGPARWPAVPRQGDFYQSIIDTMQLIRTEDRRKIEKISHASLISKRSPIVIMTIADLRGVESSNLGWRLNKYGKDVFNHYGIGEEQFNRGVLLLAVRNQMACVTILGKGVPRHLYEAADKAVASKIESTLEENPTAWSLAILRGVTEIQNEIIAKMPPVHSFAPDAVVTAYMGGATH